MRTKVMHIIGDLSVGGAEQALNRLLSRTDHRRFESHVVALRSVSGEASLTDELRSQGVTVHELHASGRRGMLKAFARLIWLSWTIRPHIVQGWMYHGALAALLVSGARAGKSVLVWNIRHALNDLRRESFPTRQVIRAASRLSRLPSATIYNSQASAAQHESIGFTARHHWVIPNGFDLDDFHPADAAPRVLRRALGIPDNAFVVGHVARYHPVKGHTNLIDAAALIRLAQPDVHFVLVGKFVAPDNQILMGQIKAAGLELRVHLLGERQDIAAIMAGLDVLVVSSRSEAFPNVLGEAMACAVACVTTDVGDAAWVVGDTGKVAPPNDPRALADAVSALLSLQPADRKILGEAARQRVAKEFSIERMVANYSTLFRTLSPGK